MKLFINFLRLPAFLKLPEQMKYSINHFFTILPFNQSILEAAIMFLDTHTDTPRPWQLHHRAPHGLQTSVEDSLVEQLKGGPQEVGGLVDVPHPFLCVRRQTAPDLGPALSPRVGGDRGIPPRRGLLPPLLSVQGAHLLHHRLEPPSHWGGFLRLLLSTFQS